MSIKTRVLLPHLTVFLFYSYRLVIVSVPSFLGKLPFATGGLIAAFALSACSSPSLPTSPAFPAAPPARADTLPTVVSAPVAPAPVRPSAPVSADPPRSSQAATPATAGSPVDLAPTERLVTQLHAQGLDPAWVRRQLEQARRSDTVSRLILPPASPSVRSWPRYRARFLDAQRIREGVAFAERHHRMLQATAEQSGVPVEIIVAIIGVETFYGRVTGNFRVIDALYTLAFHYPAGARSDRSAFFQDQLAAFLRWTYQTRQDPQTLKGSYAGAMGLPQFMPGSILNWAKDGDGDGKIDLLNSVDDAIASVGEFLKAHGWQRGQPVFVPMDLPANPAPLVDGGLTPTLSWTQLLEAGARPRQSRAHAGLLGVIDLFDGASNTTEYRVAADNFFVITQYNRSYFYATSVADLADAIRRARG